MTWFLAVMLLCRDGGCTFVSDPYLSQTEAACRESLDAATQAYSRQGFATFGQCVTTSLRESKLS